MQDAVLGNAEEWASALLQGRDNKDDDDTYSASQSVSSYYTGVTGTNTAFDGSSSSLPRVPVLSTLRMFQSGPSSLGSAAREASSTGSGNHDVGNSSSSNSNSSSSNSTRSGSSMPPPRLDVSNLFHDQAWSLMEVNEEAEATLVDDGAFKGDLTHSHIYSLDGTLGWFVTCRRGRREDDVRWYHVALPGGRS